MLSKDWVDHLRWVMDHAKPGDMYEVMHVQIDPETNSVHNCGGSTYVRTELGYRNTKIENRELVIHPPFKL